MSERFQGKIAILGAGALGAYYGARLYESGHDVHFLMRSHYDAVKARGLKVTSCHGDFHIEPPVYKDVKEIGVCDLVIIGIKATQNDALPELLEHTVGPKTVVLTLQNGLGNEEVIEAVLKRLGHDNPGARITGGIAFLCSNAVGPGHIDHTAHGHIRLAEYSSDALERTHLLARSFEASKVGTEVFDSLLHIRWSKLVWNIPFNGLGVAAIQADTQVVLNSPPLMKTARRLMEETLAAAKSEGVEISDEFIEQMIHNTTSMGAYESSMQIDAAERRPLEVEAILGEPLRRAQRAGIDTPCLEFLYGIVKRANHLILENRND